MTGAVWAIARNELRLVAKDPFPPIWLLVLPTVVIALLTPGMDAYAELVNASSGGAERSVPAGAVTFSFFLIGNMGVSFFREHDWRTWGRVRASRAGSLDILFGKSIPWAFVALCQQLILFGFGAFVFGLGTPARPLAAVVLLIALVACVCSCALALIGLTRTLSQLQLASYVGALGLGGLGGTLTPIDLMPDWVQAIAPFTPAYWAMTGLLDVFGNDAGLADVTPNVAVLVAFAVGGAAVAAWRLRFADVKQL